MTPYVQVTRRLRHSTSSRSQYVHHISHSSPRRCFRPAIPMLQDISELPPFWRLQLRAWQPRQHVIPDLRRLLRNQIFPHVHNVPCPLAWVAMNIGEFSVCNHNNQAALIAVVTINQHVQIMWLRGSRLYRPLTSKVIINRHSFPTRRVLLTSGSSFRPIKLNIETLTNQIL